MINKLYISTVEYNWNNVNSILIDRHNIDEIISRTDMVDCHTSPEDLYCENISVACNGANEIVLVNIDETVIVTNNNCFLYGRLFNELTRHKNKIKEFVCKKDLNFLKNTRSTSDPVLWTAGCSITTGTGVTATERWGSLLANSLNLTEISLAQEGSSIWWSVDQILRSDIKQGDIVVWGLTNVPRVEYSNNWNFISTNVTAYLRVPKKNQYYTLDYFESETQVLFALREILQVINFCQKIKVKLYLVNLFDIAWIGVRLRDFENFIDLTQDLVIKGNTIEFIDLGTDNIHPGPRQHQQYAEKIFNLIKESNYGKTI